MTIIIDARTASDHFPGIGRYVVNLTRALQQLPEAVPLTQLHAPPSPFSLSQQWRVPRTLRRLGATLYHSPYYLMPYRPGVPTVLTCYDIIPLLFPAYFTARQRIVFRLAHGLALRTASVVLAISQATRDDLVQRLRVDPRKVHVTPLAADEHFRPQPVAEVARVRHAHGLPEHYVLYVGTNKPHKNLVRLVRAWAALGTSARGAGLVIAGYWDARYPQARQAAAASGTAERMLFAGAVPDADLPALYSGALGFVFPSLHEGFGLPVLEAMACGTPVACSLVSSLPEVAAEAALRIDPLDEASITAALARLLAEADLRAELRERGRLRAADFSWERTARQTLAAYRSAGYVG